MCPSSPDLSCIPCVYMYIYVQQTSPPTPSLATVCPSTQVQPTGLSTPLPLAILSSQIIVLFTEKTGFPGCDLFHSRQAVKL